MFPDILRSYCKVDIKYFPFDRQNCTLELQSWSRTKREVEVKNDDEKPFQNHSFIHTEWKLLNITVSVLEHNDFVWLEYMIHLKRNHAFYGTLSQYQHLCGYSNNANFSEPYDIPVCHSLKS